MDDSLKKMGISNLSHLHSMEKVDEQFNNFMYKVNEVSSIVNKLASTDADVQKIGDLEAKTYLGEDKQGVLDNIKDEDDITLVVKNDKTVINKKYIQQCDQKDTTQVSQEIFMAEVERDADRRYKDKQVRRERMETFKKQANLAFRRGEYERSLTLYNKAIEQIRDSILLYNNRALTYIKLQQYDQAKKDLEDWALRLNEDCLKTWLLLAKVHYLTGNRKGVEKSVKEAKTRNPSQEQFIDEYISDMTTEADL